MSVLAPPEAFWRVFPLDEFTGRVIRAHARAPMYLTSWWRSWRHNIAVGGSHTPVSQGGRGLSQHLAGLAIDAVPLDQTRTTTKALADELADQGLVVVPYATHVHAQLFNRGGLDRLLGI